VGKWEAPRDFRSEQASRADQREMTPMVIRQNTCPWCDTTYKTRKGSEKCETWHKVFFRKARADLAAAIEKARARRDYTMVRRLTRERDKYPSDL